MLYQITNLTHSSKAFRSVNSGEMVFIPPKSEGTYDLAPLSSLDFSGLEIKEVSATAVASEPAPIEAEVMAAESDPALSPVEEPAPERTSRRSRRASAVEPDAADWQAGLSKNIQA